MKKSQLRKVIREAITEVLAEGNTYAGKDAIDDAQKDSKWGSLSGVGKADAITKLKAGGTVTIGEAEIAEMANIGKLFQLSPDADLSTLTGQKLRIATAMQDAGGSISQADVAKALGYTKVDSKGEIVGKQNPIDANFRALGAEGIIIPAGTQLAQRFSRPQPEPGEEGDEEVGQRATEPEDLFMGSATNPLSMYFDNEPNDDGTEDFNAEEEPTTGEIEPTSTAAGSMSDEDYDVWMKWSDLNDRLSATKSNILKAKRNKGGKVMGDIGDTSSNEISRLTTLKQSLEDRMNDLVAKSKYLQKKIEKETGKAYEPIEIEPEEEDTLDEAYNAEYEKRKLQFYAGIIK
jgi:hypothetical protein